MDTLFKLFRSLIEYIPFWIFLTVMRLFKYKKRVIIGSFIISFVIRKIPKFRKRVFDNLELIFPSFSKEDKNKFLKEFANNLGLTFIEFLFNGEYHQLQKIKLQNESQFDEIQEAFKNKKPIIIVSGHIGPWEAVRAILKRKGIETAAIYRKSKNLFYEPYHFKVISEGGKPVFQSGRKETKDIVKYLRKGGVLCVMIDQSISNGKYINFLGHPAKTSMVIPKIALKYDALIIPAFAIRPKYGDFVEVFIEPSVKLTTEEDIMIKINRILEKKILHHPHQWYWVHNRWK